MYTAKTLNRPPATRPRAPFVQEGLDWEAAGWAGLAAGAVFLALQTILAAAAGGGATVALRQIAAVALGSSVVSPSAPLSTLVVLAAVAVHLPLSLLYARALAALIDGRPTGIALAAGAAFGAAIYGVNYLLIGSRMPWVSAARGWAPFSSHVAFGLVAAAVYSSLARRKSGFR